MADDLEVGTMCPQEGEVLRSTSSQISCPGGGLQALWQEPPERPPITGDVHSHKQEPLVFML